MTVVVRTSADPAHAVPSIQRAIWSLNPAVSFAGIETLSGLLRDTLAARRFTLTLLSGLSLVAIVLASIGLYGLVSFSVNARTSEIGIRLALGAGSDSVVGLVMRQGMSIALAGLAAGVAASLLLTRCLRTMLFGVTVSDPATLPASRGRSCSGQRGRVLPAGAARDPGRSTDRDSRVTFSIQDDARLRQPKSVEIRRKALVSGPILGNTPYLPTYYTKRRGEFLSLPSSNRKSLHPRARWKVGNEGRARVRSSHARRARDIPAAVA